MSSRRATRAKHIVVPKAELERLEAYAEAATKRWQQAQCDVIGYKHFAEYLARCSFVTPMRTTQQSEYEAAEMLWRIGNGIQ